MTITPRLVNWLRTTARSKVWVLMPWQSPPCYPTMNALDQPYGDAGAKRELAELALRMHRCGVSRWRPNPVAACEAAEAEQRRP